MCVQSVLKPAPLQINLYLMFAFSCTAFGAPRNRAPTRLRPNAHLDAQRLAYSIGFLIGIVRMHLRQRSSAPAAAARQSSTRHAGRCNCISPRGPRRPLLLLAPAVAEDADAVAFVIWLAVGGGGRCAVLRAALLPGAAAGAVCCMRS